MTTLLKLKSDQIAARKARDHITATLLTTLIGEIQTEMTKVPESERNLAKEGSVLEKTVNRFLKQNRESQGLVGADIEATSVLKHEETILMQYQPTYLSVKELVDLVEFLDFKEKKDFFAHFKAHHSGEYQGKDVNEAWEEYQARRVV